MINPWGWDGGWAEFTVRRAGLTKLDAAPRPPHAVIHPRVQKAFRKHSLCAVREKKNMSIFMLIIMVLFVMFIMCNVKFPFTFFTTRIGFQFLGNCLLWTKSYIYVYFPGRFAQETQWSRAWIATWLSVRIKRNILHFLTKQNRMPICALWFIQRQEKKQWSDTLSQPFSRLGLSFGVLWKT